MSVELGYDPKPHWRRGVVVAVRYISLILLAGKRMSSQVRFAHRDCCKSSLIFGSCSTCPGIEVSIVQVDGLLHRIWSGEYACDDQSQGPGRTAQSWSTACRRVRDYVTTVLDRRQEIFDFFNGCTACCKITGRGRTRRIIGTALFSLRCANMYFVGGS